MGDFLGDKGDISEGVPDPCQDGPDGWISAPWLKPHAHPVKGKAVRAKIEFILTCPACSSRRKDAAREALAALERDPRAVLDWEALGRKAA